MILNQIFNLLDDDIELPDSILKKIRIIPDIAGAETPFSSEVSVSIPCCPETNNIDGPLGTEPSTLQGIEKTEIYLPQVTAVADISNYNAAHGVVVRVAPIVIKFTSLMLDEPQLKRTEDAAKIYRSSESQRILQGMPIESLNHNKRGIRVSALRSAGYSNVQQIRHVSYQNLLNIRGIGAQSACLIQEEILMLEQYAAQQVIMKPILRQTKEGLLLVREYYKYCRLRDLKATVTHCFSAIYNLLKSDYAIAKVVQNRVAWFFTFGDARKKIAFDAVIRINSILSEKVVIEVEQHFETRQSILKTSDDIAWSEYMERQSEYNTMFGNM